MGGRGSRGMCPSTELQDDRWLKITSEEPPHRCSSHRVPFLGPVFVHSHPCPLKSHILPCLDKEHFLSVWVLSLPSCFLQWGGFKLPYSMCKTVPSLMGRGWGPPAYLAPLPHDTPKTKEHWESLLLSPNLRGANPNWTNFLCRTLLYIYYPFAADDTSFGLEDGGLLNELTLWIFDSGYWWSTSEPVLTQRVFCSGLFPVSTLCSSRCLLLPSSQSAFP